MKTITREQLIPIINKALSDREQIKFEYMNRKIRPAIPKLADFIADAIIKESYENKD